MNKRHLSIILSCLLFSSLPSFAFATDHKAHESSTVSDTAVQVEASIGHFEIEDNDGDDSDGQSINAAGSFAFNLLRAHIQLDSMLRYEDGDGSATNWSIGGHFGLRDETRGHIALNTSFNKLRASDNINAKYYRLGAEAEYFIDRLTIGGAIGTLHVIASDEDETDSGELNYFKGLVRYYIRDNLKIEGSFGRVKTEGESGEVDYTHLLAEYGFNDRPITLFTRWNGLFIDDGDGDEIDTHQFLVGFKMNFGGAQHSTIKTNDRRYFADKCLFENVAAIC